MKLVFSDKKERHGLRHFGRVAGQAEKMERLRHAFHFGAGTFGTDSRKDQQLCDYSDRPRSSASRLTCRCAVPLKVLVASRTSS